MVSSPPKSINAWADPGLKPKLEFTSTPAMFVYGLLILLLAVLVQVHSQQQTFNRQDRDYRPLQFGKRDGYRPLQFGKRDFGKRQYRPLQFGKRSDSTIEEQLFAL